jgi:peptide/nickel transport system ATP-binding protein
MEPVLQVEGLKIRYHTREGTLTAIRDLSLEVGSSEIVGVVGESGCGKSTIASAVLRLLPPNGEISDGRVLFKGQNLLELDGEAMRSLRGREMSMIFQDPMTSLNPVFTIEEQMLDALRANRRERGGSRAALRQKAAEMLRRVDIPDAETRLGDYPHQFSGGMRQRIMIAMALLANPALLIADEPTSALDVTLEAQIVDLIRGLRDELGTAILYITHDLGVVAQLCDRVVVMYAGNLVETGEVHSLFEAPRHPYTQALLRSHPSRGQRTARLVTIPGRVPSLRELPAGCKFAPRCQQAQAVCHEAEPPLLEVGSHQVLCRAYAADWAGASPEVEVTAPAPAVSARQIRDEAQVMVETRDLRTHFRDRAGVMGQILGLEVGCVRAVEQVSLQIRRGETLAVVGESGSGKTTLGRTILRLQNPTEGTLLVQQQDITRMRASRLRPMRARMQMIFQDPCSSLSPRMKVADLLLEPFRIHRVPVGSPAEKVDALLQMVGLSAEQADKYAHQLSGGQARRVGIARALALEPELLVADEPTAGLDVSVAAGVLNLLKDLRERLDLTYLIITHNLNIINFIADRAAVMYLGRVVELASTDLLFHAPAHPYTVALMSAIAVPDPGLRDSRQRIVLQGEIPSPRNPPPGCPFHPRCRLVVDRCRSEAPLLRALQEGEHWAACHLAEGG